MGWPWFDTYKLPSNKYIKPKDRENEETTGDFTFGSMQKVSDSIHDLLQMSEFKTEFVKVLMKEYNGHAYLLILAYKIFYCYINNICRKFYVFDSCLKVKKVHNLYVNHLEPDPKVQYSVLYMHKITDSGNIVAGTNDSDILMILLLIV